MILSKKHNLLVIGRHGGMLASVLEMLHTNGYDATGCTTDAQAIEMFNTLLPDAVVIGGGVEASSRALFHNQFSHTKPDAVIIDAHPNTLLQELHQALGK